MTSRRPLNLALVASLSLALAACSATGPVKSSKDSKAPVADAKAVETSTGSPYPSTYKPAPSTPTLIRGATVLVGNGKRLDNADVLIRDGLIAAVGTQIEAPADARIVEGQGKWVTPGLIDVHSHLGVYPSPGVEAHSDGNEATAPSTAQVWSEHSIWPQDPGFEAALEGGITTLHVLPGSANLFGGRSVTVKNISAVTYQSMKFPDAPHGLKMACGENPKRVYGNRRQMPSTRMGNVAGWRAQWIEAQEYARDWKQYETRKAAGVKDLRPPKRDLRLETLAAVLRGEILVQHHCYRADEMAIVIDMSREFGYRVSAFHHATEAYKISNLLAENNICAAVWADWWGFKMESYDAIPENMILVDAAPGGCAVVHSDSAEGIQRLNQEAAKGMARARRMGLDITPEHAITWLTQNAARVIGLDSKIGTLEVGKMGDVVVWNGNPFSVYALTEKIYVDGALRFDRAAPRAQPESDFLLGQPAYEGVIR
ncbi:MAG: amidohydrolase [Gammaproteobacteria bacterium]|jgi:imidazolonepropionase-like amidohydrolase|nr:amidohydrolase [Gammaproteobacteria bacterium]